jgi:hypothetical protein
MNAEHVYVTSVPRAIGGTSISITEEYFGANFFNSGPTTVRNWFVVASLIRQDQSFEAAKPEEPEARTQLTVIHDRHGSIDGLVTSPPGSLPLQVELKVGQYATEVDAPGGMTTDLDPAAVYELLAEWMKHYRIDVGSMRGVLATAAPTE